MDQNGALSLALCGGVARQFLQGHDAHLDSFSVARPGDGLYGGRGTSAVHGVRVQEDQIGRAPTGLEINRIPRHYAAGGLGASELELQ